MESASRLVGGRWPTKAGQRSVVCVVDLDAEGGVEVGSGDTDRTVGVHHRVGDEFADEECGVSGQVGSARCRKELDDRLACLSGSPTR